MLVGIVGRSVDPDGRTCSMGTGKDTVSDAFVQGGCVKIGLADPMKRIVMDLYNFTEGQLWGQSELRNVPDKRLPREAHTIKNGKCACCGEPLGSLEPCYLTPRYALQTVGDEWGRNCYLDTWVDKLLSTVRLLRKGDCYYDTVLGLRYTTSFSDSMWPKTNVVVSDVRRLNELKAIQKAGGHLVLVERCVLSLPEGVDLTHGSEAELSQLDDADFTAIISNDGTLEDLRYKARDILTSLLSK